MKSFVQLAKDTVYFPFAAEDALIQAVIHGDVDLVAHLLDMKVKCDIALIHACGKGYVDVARLLLDNNQHDMKLSVLALRVAEKNKHAAVVRLLSQRIGVRRSQRLIEKYM
jgi:ankyrin repeat protein